MRADVAAVRGVAACGRMGVDVGGDTMEDAATGLGGNAGEDNGDRAGEARAKGVKTRRTRAAKADAGVGEDKRSLNLRVDVATYERLTIHAMKRRMTISDLVSDLARAGCKDFAVHRVGQRGDGSGEG